MRTTQDTEMRLAQQLEVRKGIHRLLSTSTSSETDSGDSVDCSKDSLLRLSIWLLFPPSLLPPAPSQVTPHTFDMQQFSVTLEINSFNKKAGSSDEDVRWTNPTIV